jgi:integrase
MASIRKRGKKFQAIIRRSGHETISRTFALRKNAVEWARDIELKADRMGMPQNLKVLGQTTLSDMLIKYRDTVIPQKRSPKNEIIIINAFLRHQICLKTLAELKSEDFERYKVERLKSVLGSTINREFNIIKHAFNVAIDVWELPLNKNPLASVKKAPNPKSRERQLTDVELDRLISTAQKVRNLTVAPLILFALETAMRRGELLNIKKEHYHTENKTLFIPETKTGHSRTIPLSTKAQEIISNANSKDKAFPIHIKALEYHWKQICLKAEIDDFNFHDLRHTCITKLFEKGLSVPEVALISGHKCIKQLYAYVHIQPENLVSKLQ